jgi:hypothetical protein
VTAYSRWNRLAMLVSAVWLIVVSASAINELRKPRFDPTQPYTFVDAGVTMSGTRWSPDAPFLQRHPRWAIAGSALVVWLAPSVLLVGLAASQTGLPAHESARKALRGLQKA